MKDNKIFQPEQITVKRSQINFASYNPRVMSDDARKKLKGNMTKIGLLGGVVWNKRTGNLVSGHQRVAIMDSVNRYSPENEKSDYEFRVEVVDLDEKTEKEQNLFMNNKNVQGEYDDDMLRQMLVDIDYDAAGFNELDMELLGLSDFSDYNQVVEEGMTTEDVPTATNPVDVGHGAWTKESAMGDNVHLAAHDEATKGGQENTKIDRSTDFYNDTEANQIARHNEVQKIKDRINSQNDINKDGGMLSYVVISFKTPTEKMAFMDEFGYDPFQKYINGDDFMNRLEFGVEEDDAETEE